MAEQTKKAPEPQLKINPKLAPETPPVTFLMRLKRWLKIIIGILLLLCLIVGGFFLGIYLRVFDLNVVNEKLELYKYPILNEYFVKSDKPSTVIDTAPEPMAKAVTPEPIKPADDAKKITAAPETPKPVVLTKEEIDKQMKIRQTEEKKRIGKLARLYGQMKPDDAVAILDGLNDDMVIAILGKMEEEQVAKILVAFDADRSSRITRVMYNGRPPLVGQAR